MTCNSYIITDEKTTVIDSVDAHFTEVRLNNIRNVLDGKAPDRIIVQHMQPDRSGSLLRFPEAYLAATAAPAGTSSPPSEENSRPK